MKKSELAVQQQQQQMQQRRGEMRNPLRELTTLQQGIDQLFGELTSTFFGGPPLSAGSFVPLADIQETDTEYRVSVDLPGAKKSDIRVEINNNQLTVSGERKEEREESGKGRGRFEKSYGYFERSFLLPSNVDPDKIQASYHDGVVEIVVPKAESARARQIQLEEKKKESSKAA